MSKKRTPETDAQIRAMKHRGASTRELARHFDLSVGTIHAICRPASGAARTIPAAASHVATVAPMSAPDEIDEDEADPHWDVVPVSNHAKPLSRVTGAEVTAPSRDDVRRILGGVAATLEKELASATEPSHRASLARALVGAGQALSKMTPGEETPEGYYVSSEVMEREAAKGRKMFYALAENIVRVASSPVAVTIQKLLAERRAEEAAAAEKKKRGDK